MADASSHMGADAMAVPAQLVDHKTFAYVRCMARAAELDAINAFVAVRGATRCPPAFAAPAIGALPSAQEAAKLAGVQVPAAPHAPGMEADLLPETISPGELVTSANRIGAGRATCESKSPPADGVFLYRGTRAKPTSVAGQAAVTV